MVVVSTETIHGHEIERVIGVVSAVATPKFKDTFSNTEKVINRLYAEAIERLIETAGDKGANAIVGLRLTPPAISNTCISALCVVYGTAVVISR